MDIIFEAFGYHKIEQCEREAKYKDRFESEMKVKVEVWNGVLSKWMEGEELSLADQAFMAEESLLSSDGQLARIFPYLDGHIERLQKEHDYWQVLQMFQDLIPRQHQFIDSIYSSAVLFGKRKKLVEFTKHSTRLDQEAKGLRSKLVRLRKKECLFKDSWNFEQENLQALIYKLDADIKLSLEEQEELLRLSKLSIMNQMDSGRLFFAHHFDRVKRAEWFMDEIESYMEVFRVYERAISNIANTQPEKIKWFDLGYKLESLKEICDSAKCGTIWSYRTIVKKIAEAS